eukprot:1148392-Pelagomonas_calceolata.AAC.1
MLLCNDAKVAMPQPTPGRVRRALPPPALLMPAGLAQCARLPGCCQATGRTGTCFEERTAIHMIPFRAGKSRDKNKTMQSETPIMFEKKL